MLSVIIPASNEQDYIGPCLTALFASGPMGAEVIVVANGCRDATAARARAMQDQAQAAGWALTVLDLPEGGKPHALNTGDSVAQGEIRAYLDADVIVSPRLMAELHALLTTDQPRYATGTARIPRARSALTRAYARFWQRLPFARSIAPGYGLFAVNAAGRARWGDFPAIISDDTFVRLHFAPDERRQSPAPYDWPMIEGFAALTRVRRRQDAVLYYCYGVYPDLHAKDDKARLGMPALLLLALQDPAGFIAYTAVSLAVRLRRGSGWARGR